MLTILYIYNLYRCVLYDPRGDSPVQLDAQIESPYKGRRAARQRLRRRCGRARWNNDRSVSSLRRSTDAKVPKELANYRLSYREYIEYC